MKEAAACPEPCIRPSDRQKFGHSTIRLLVRLLCIWLVVWSAAAPADDVELPRVMAWSAYNLGTTGYNQAVGIAKMLKDRHRITLRVVPGKNDVSRLLPLRVDRVQFSANGVSTYFAQEGTFQFASERWGPMPVQLVMMSLGLSNQAVAVPADSDIYVAADLNGRRVPYVRGAPAVNVSTEAMLACGGLTWDDVERIEFPGYSAMWNGIVEGHIDVAYATTVSGPTRKLEASPKGIRWLPAPHDDEACWQRLLKVAPYFSRHIAVRGAGISKDRPHEGATYPYPLLMTLADRDEAFVYHLTKLLHLGYDDYSRADPGSIGWHIDRQNFTWVVPFHAGAVRYYREIGRWGEAADAHNSRLLERQKVLAAAWDETLALIRGEAAVFSAAELPDLWMQMRALRLRQQGFDPVWE
ncbi:MAG: TAXI family TRAP transporter solute-binding subunit [Gammaproteobacteria bacterium]